MPHLYDAVNNAWQLYGAGIDAVCWYEGSRLFFRDQEAFHADGKQTLPKIIADQFPKLPPSFQLGVHGAANVSKQLYLLRSGLYVRPDGTQPAKPLNQIDGWPQTAPWKDGVIDLAGSADLIADIYSAKVIWRPVDLAAGYGSKAVELLETGQVNGLLYNGSVSSAKSPLQVFTGAAIWGFGGTQDNNPSAKYVGAFDSWPQKWHPQLAHARNGRSENLWAAMANGEGVVYHDGTQWNLIPGEATYAIVGQDNSVFTVGKGQSAIWRWQGGTSFDQIRQAASASLNQISAGDAKTVWA